MFLWRCNKKNRGYRCLRGYLWASCQRSVPASSKTDRFFWLRHVCSVTFSGHVHCNERERETELERRGATHTTKPPSQCPAVPLFPDPALVIEAHWLGWRREATIVRVSLFVNPQPPTLGSLGNSELSKFAGVVSRGAPNFVQIQF